MFKVHEVTTLDVLVMYGSVALLVYGTYHIGKIVGKEEVAKKLKEVYEEYQKEVKNGVE